MTTFANLTSGMATSTTGPVTASITLTANRLALLSVIHCTFGVGTAPAAPTISGWTQEETAGYVRGGTDYRVSVFRRMAGTNSTGTHTISFGAVSQEQVCWSIDESSADVDTTGTNGSGAIVQSVPTDGTGTTALTTLAAFSDAANATFGAIALGYNTKPMTEGSGFTWLAKVNDATGFQDVYLLTEYKVANDTTVDGSGTISSEWGAIGIEVKYPAAGTTIAWLRA